MKNLVIVESPNKVKTIEKFLGSDYEVKSSYGHIRDLAKKDMSIDIENNYEPQYEISEDKSKLVNELKKAVGSADMVWLASDEDREGEAIAWHLYETLKLNQENSKRIVFNSITKDVVLHAIENPRNIDMNLVNAQQARRVLDRLVGYEISPILWTKIKPALSAGRVQSVAVRLIVERENEVNAFQSQSFFRLTATFLSKDKQVISELNRRFDTEAEANEFMQKLIGASFTIEKVETKPARRSPVPPFTTSTLQQEASRKLGYSVARTMQIAQQLYESGHITYMRTDSTNLSTVALDMAKAEIDKLYGEKYVKIRNYHTKIKGAQEAHEAIRPTDMSVTNINADSSQRRLYELIWKRTIASQMADAEIEKTAVEIGISTASEKFTCSGEQILFDGFLKVYFESTDDEQESDNQPHMLPKLKKDSVLSLVSAEASQHYTQHPPRYTEASLVKKLEDLGIGRPSTYVPTISTILKREYVIKEDRDAQLVNVISLALSQSGNIKRIEKTEKIGAEKGKLFPTDVGTIVNNFLMAHFSDILDYNFTAKVEKDFDDIASGKKEWRKVIDRFYVPFHQNVKSTQTKSKRTSGERLLGQDPASGKNVYAKIGRYGTRIQIGETNNDDKPRFASMKKGQGIETITLEEALELFNLPRNVGEFEGHDVVVSIGRFGPYVRHDDKFYSLSKSDDPYTIEFSRCCEIIEQKRVAAEEKERLRELFPRLLGTYEDHEVFANMGKYGPYLSYDTENYRLPKAKFDPLTLTIDDAIAVIRESKEKKTSPGKKKTGRKPATKKQ